MGTCGLDFQTVKFLSVLGLKNLGCRIFLETLAEPL